MNIRKKYFLILSGLFLLPLLLSLVMALTASQIGNSAWNTVFGTNNSIPNVLNYIFGQTITIDGVNAIASAVITIALWALIFITFSDILASFSSFSRRISWFIGFFIAVIVANLNGPRAVLLGMTSAFAFAGAAALYLGLLGALVAFFAVNWGIVGLGTWLKGRRLMMKAEEDSWGAKAGGKKLAGLYEAQGEMTKALAKVGDK